MALIDGEKFRSYHRKAEKNFPDTFVGDHIPNGEIMLIDEAGETTFDEVEALAAKPPEELTSKEMRKLKAFQNALADFTMESCIPSINLVVSDSGVAMSFEAQEFGEGSFKIATPAQIEKYQNIFHQKGLKNLYHFQTASGGVIGKGVFDDEG